MGEALGDWVSAKLCCLALRRPGPESGSEQLAALEQKLHCLEQEKMEMSQKLQGTGEPDRLWVRV